MHAVRRSERGIETVELAPMIPSAPACEAFALVESETPSLKLVLEP